MRIHMLPLLICHFHSKEDTMNQWLRVIGLLGIMGLVASR